MHSAEDGKIMVNQILNREVAINDLGIDFQRGIIIRSIKEIIVANINSTMIHHIERSRITMVVHRQKISPSVIYRTEDEWRQHEV